MKTPLLFDGHRASPVLATLLVAVALAGCRGGISTKPPVHLNLDMDLQQKLKAQSESTFAGWKDKRGMRTPVAGTVARDGLVGDPAELLQRYDRDGDGGLSRVEAAALKVGKRRFAIGDENADGLLDAADVGRIAALFSDKVGSDWVTENPLPATEEWLERGREQFTINCSVCHGVSGTGGLVAKRWAAPVPNLVSHADAGTRARLVGMSAGELVSVISEGKGTMPPYASQVRMEDRWAIAHYLKALQKHFN